jgi:hypothetical protein
MTMFDSTFNVISVYSQQSLIFCRKKRNYTFIQTSKELGKKIVFYFDSTEQENCFTQIAEQNNNCFLQNEKVFTFFDHPIMAKQLSVELFLKLDTSLLL